ncbi:MAG: ABC transporter permease, partial [Ignavibacteriaceae bacterium]
MISKKIAEKYFGYKNPIGKNLIYDNKYNFTITGVFETPPLNTHLRCDFIAPYSRTVEIQNINLPWNRWGEDYTYLLLKDNASPDGLNKKLTQLLAKNTNEKFASMLQFYVIPFSDIYLKSDMMGELGPTGNLTSIYLFSTIALLLLIIACLNFVNLSTARSLRRSREVGLRKVLGAQ